MSTFDRLPEQLVGRLRLLAAVAGAVVVAAAVVVSALTPPTPPAPELTIPMAVPATVAPAATPAPAELWVHVAGAVVAPGLYELGPSARVADAISAAGGVLVTADLDRVNLAAALHDGQRLWVPVEGEEPPPVVAGVSPSGAGAAGSGPAPDGAAIDVNTADAALLESLPGVGPATAAAIIAHRDQRGPFATVDQLLDVRGIGPAKLAALRDLVVAGT